MDSALNKVGIYGIFAVLLTGIIVLLTWIILGLPIPAAFSGFDEGMTVLLFVVGSYFIGIVLQEIGDYVDRKYFEFQDKVKRNFMNSDVFSNPLELNDLTTIANQILMKEAGNTAFTESEQLYVFFHCKDYLEVRDKDGKAESLSAAGDMSRSMMIAFFTYIILYSLFFLWNAFVSGCSILDFFVCAMKLFILGCLIHVFHRRAEKYAFLRIRAIFRHYKMLSQS